jgi:predicted RNase H-like HicB family nuclease
MMRYPIAIEPGNDSTAWGVVVPDLQGCFSAGDTQEEAIINAEEAIEAWIEAALDAGLEIPAPSSLQALQACHPEFAGWVWGLVKIDPDALDSAVERVNISLPKRVLHRLDMLARHDGETRSGLIARMTIERRQRGCVSA